MTLAAAICDPCCEFGLVSLQTDRPAMFICTHAGRQSLGFNPRRKPDCPKGNEPMPATATRTTKKATGRSATKKTAAARRKAVTPVASSEKAGPMLLEVPVDRIDVVENDRTEFDPAELKKLSESIKRSGIIQPLVAVLDNKERFRLVAGERRLRAAKLAKLTTVPVMVRTPEQIDSDGTDVAIMRLEENLHRVDLSPIERANALRKLIEDHGMKQKDVAKLVGCSASQISNEVRLLQLPDTWQQWIASGKLAPTAARVLIPWVKRPQVLQWLVNKYSDQIDLGEFEVYDWQLWEAIEACTRSCVLTQDNTEWTDPKATDCCFRIKTSDKAEIADLDIQQIKLGHRDTPRAWNVDRWNERNAQGLQKRRDKRKKIKAEKAKTTGSSKAGKSDKSKAKYNPEALAQAFERQLLQIMAARLNARKHKVGIAQMVLYLAATDGSYVLGELPAFKEAQTGMGYHLKMMTAIGNISDKDWSKKLVEFLREALVRLSHDQFGSDSFQGPAMVVAAAELFLGEDLLTDWKPSRDCLAAFDIELLQAYGRDLLHIAIEDQPPHTDTEAIFDWFESDWPVGQIPAEFRNMIKGATE